MSNNASPIGKPGGERDCKARSRKVIRNRSADGLRGLAALVVVVTHFVHAFWPALLRNNYPYQWMGTEPNPVLDLLLRSPPAALIFNSHFAVILFFVLSGFVLSQPALTGDLKSLRARAWARYFRLNIPIAAASILSWLVLWLELNWNHEAAAISSSDWFGAYFNRDVSLVTLLRTSIYGGLMGSTVLVPPVWSLKIEFLGSMMLLGSLALAPSKRGNLLALGACSLGVLLLRPNDFIFFLCFFAGAAINYVRASTTVGGWLAVIGLIFGSYHTSAGPFAWVPTFAEARTTYNAVGAAFLVVGVCKAQAASSFLESPIPQYLGRVSYSIYLIHFSVLCSAASYVVMEVGVGPFGLLASFVVYLGVALLVSELFTRYIDALAIRLGHGFSRWVDGPRNSDPRAA